MTQKVQKEMFRRCADPDHKLDSTIRSVVTKVDKYGTDRQRN